MLILGIESSCDETGAAIVKDGRYLLSNVVASQIEVHNRYGGVVPEVASRQQLATIIPVLETAMEQADCSWENIDAVAATYGPGLAGSRLVGLTAGKAIALAVAEAGLGRAWKRIFTPTGCARRPMQGEHRKPMKPIGNTRKATLPFL